MAIRALLFDIDGTLIDSNERHVDAWGLAFREAGRPQELDAIRAQIGKGGDQLMPALLPDEPALHTPIAERQGAIFADLYLPHVRPFPGAAELVRAVAARGRAVVLASSAKRAELDVYLDRLALRDVVTATTSSDEVEASKPAPDIFAAALAAVGVAPEEALAIGDTPYDVEAAARSGVATVALLSGPFDEEALRAAGAIALYADAAALLAGLEESPLLR
ncbi:HAD family hydrolase [Sphingomonas morindae]|uniref:HAD family hydrolase n=1 Tax=Sphingomonas morindae TaxID=1541170 RepID=A0ABY4X4Y0_9SPHN|nr:HAD family hydrolase [Sphingomonas morindae]USI71915.1 HAD family hydrolase [Sphingomonas morindae]